MLKVPQLVSAPDIHLEKEAQAVLHQTLQQLAMITLAENMMAAYLVQIQNKIKTINEALFLTINTILVTQEYYLRLFDALQKKIGEEHKGKQIQIQKIEITKDADTDVIKNFQIQVRVENQSEPMSFTIELSELAVGKSASNTKERPSLKFEKIRSVPTIEFNFQKLNASETDKIFEDARKEKKVLDFKDSFKITEKDLKYYNQLKLNVLNPEETSLNQKKLFQDYFKIADEKNRLDNQFFFQKWFTGGKREKYKTILSSVAEKAPEKELLNAYVELKALEKESFLGTDKKKITTLAQQIKDQLEGRVENNYLSLLKEISGFLNSSVKKRQVNKEKVRKLFIKLQQKLQAENHSALQNIINLNDHEQVAEALDKFVNIKVESIEDLNALFGAINLEEIKENIENLINHLDLQDPNLNRCLIVFEKLFPPKIDNFKTLPELISQKRNQLDNRNLLDSLITISYKGGQTISLRGLKELLLDDNKGANKFEALKPEIKKIIIEWFVNTIFSQFLKGEHEHTEFKLSSENFQFLIENGIIEKLYDAANKLELKESFATEVIAAIKRYIAMSAEPEKAYDLISKAKGLETLFSDSQFDLNKFFLDVVLYPHNYQKDKISSPAINYVLEQQELKEQARVQASKALITYFRKELIIINNQSLDANTIAKQLHDIVQMPEKAILGLPEEFITAKEFLENKEAEAIIGLGNLVYFTNQIKTMYSEEFSSILKKTQIFKDQLGKYLDLIKEGLNAEDEQFAKIKTNFKEGLENTLKGLINKANNEEELVTALDQIFSQPKVLNLLDTLKLTESIKETAKNKIKTLIEGAAFEAGSDYKKVNKLFSNNQLIKYAKGFGLEEFLSKQVVHYVSSAFGEYVNEYANVNFTNILMFVNLENIYNLISNEEDKRIFLNVIQYRIEQKIKEAFNKESNPEESALNELKGFYLLANRNKLLTNNDPLVNEIINPEKALLNFILFPHRYNRKEFNTEQIETLFNKDKEKYEYPKLVNLAKEMIANAIVNYFENKIKEGHEEVVFKQLEVTLTAGSGSKILGLPNELITAEEFRKSEITKPFFGIAAIRKLNEIAGFSKEDNFITLLNKVLNLNNLIKERQAFMQSAFDKQDWGKYGYNIKSMVDLHKKNNIRNPIYLLFASLLEKITQLDELKNIEVLFFSESETSVSCNFLEELGLKQNLVEQFQMKFKKLFKETMRSHKIVDILNFYQPDSDLNNLANKLGLNTFLEENSLEFIKLIIRSTIKHNDFELFNALFVEKNSPLNPYFNAENLNIELAKIYYSSLLEIASKKPKVSSEHFRNVLTHPVARQMKELLTSAVWDDNKIRDKFFVDNSPSNEVLDNVRIHLLGRDPQHNFAGILSKIDEDKNFFIDHFALTPNAQRMQFIDDIHAILALRNLSAEFKIDLSSNFLGKFEDLTLMSHARGRRIDPIKLLSQIGIPKSFHDKQLKALIGHARAAETLTEFQIEFLKEFVAHINKDQEIASPIDFSSYRDINEYLLEIANELDAILNNNKLPFGADLAFSKLSKLSSYIQSKSEVLPEAMKDALKRDLIFFWKKIKPYIFENGVPNGFDAFFEKLIQTAGEAKSILEILTNPSVKENFIEEKTNFNKFLNVITTIDPSSDDLLKQITEKINIDNSLFRLKELLSNRFIQDLKSVSTFEQIKEFIEQLEIIERHFVKDKNNELLINILQEVKSCLSEPKELNLDNVLINYISLKENLSASDYQLGMLLSSNNIREQFTIKWFKKLVELINNKHVDQRQIDRHFSMLIELDIPLALSNISLNDLEILIKNSKVTSLLHRNIQAYIERARIEKDFEKSEQYLNNADLIRRQLGLKKVTIIPPKAKNLQRRIVTFEKNHNEINNKIEKRPIMEQTELERYLRKNRLALDVELLVEKEKSLFNSSKNISVNLKEILSTNQNDRYVHKTTPGKILEELNELKLNLEIVKVLNMSPLLKIIKEFNGNPNQKDKLIRQLKVVLEQITTKISELIEQIDVEKLKVLVELDAGFKELLDELEKSNIEPERIHLKLQIAFNLLSNALVSPQHYLEKLYEQVEAELLVIYEKLFKERSTVNLPHPNALMVLVNIDEELSYALGKKGAISSKFKQLLLESKNIVARTFELDPSDINPKQLGNAVKIIQYLGSMEDRSRLKLQAEAMSKIYLEENIRDPSNKVQKRSLGIFVDEVLGFGNNRLIEWNETSRSTEMVKHHQQLTIVQLVRADIWLKLQTYISSKLKELAKYLSSQNISQYDISQYEDIYNTLFDMALRGVSYDEFNNIFSQLLLLIPEDTHDEIKKNFRNPILDALKAHKKLSETVNSRDNDALIKLSELCRDKKFKELLKDENQSITLALPVVRISKAASQLELKRALFFKLLEEIAHTKISEYKEEVISNKFQQLVFQLEFLKDFNSETDEPVYPDTFIQNIKESLDAIQEDFNRGNVSLILIKQMITFGFIEKLPISKEEQSDYVQKFTGLINAEKSVKSVINFINILQTSLDCPDISILELPKGNTFPKYFYDLLNSKIMTFTKTIYPHLDKNKPQYLKNLMFSLLAKTADIDVKTFNELTQELMLYVKLLHYKESTISSKDGAEDVFQEISLKNLKNLLENKDPAVKQLHYQPMVETLLSHFENLVEDADYTNPLESVKQGHATFKSHSDILEGLISSIGNEKLQERFNNLILTAKFVELRVAMREWKTTNSNEVNELLKKITEDPNFASSPSVRLWLENAIFQYKKQLLELALDPKSQLTFYQLFYFPLVEMAQLLDGKESKFVLDINSSVSDVLFNQHKRTLMAILKGNVLEASDLENLQNFMLLPAPDNEHETLLTFILRYGSEETKDSLSEFAKSVHVMQTVRVETMLDLNSSDRNLYTLEALNELEPDLFITDTLFKAVFKPKIDAVFKSIDNYEQEFRKLILAKDKNITEEDKQEFMINVNKKLVELEAIVAETNLAASKEFGMAIKQLTGLMVNTFSSSGNRFAYDDFINKARTYNAKNLLGENVESITNKLNEEMQKTGFAFSSFTKTSQQIYSEESMNILRSTVRSDMRNEYNKDKDKNKRRRIAFTNALFFIEHAGSVEQKFEAWSLLANYVAQCPKIKVGWLRSISIEEHEKYPEYVAGFMRDIYNNILGFAVDTSHPILDLNQLKQYAAQKAIEAFFFCEGNELNSVKSKSAEIQKMFELLKDSSGQQWLKNKYAEYLEKHVSVKKLEKLTLSDLPSETIMSEFERHYAKTFGKNEDEFESLRSDTLSGYFEEQFNFWFDPKQSAAAFQKIDINSAEQLKEHLMKVLTFVLNQINWPEELNAFNTYAIKHNDKINKVIKVLNDFLTSSSVSEEVKSFIKAIAHDTGYRYVAFNIAERQFELSLIAKSKEHYPTKIQSRDSLDEKQSSQLGSETQHPYSH